MENHQLINSEIAASFTEVQYLIQLIYAAGNPRERNLAVSQIWKKVSHLYQLVTILQAERNKALQQQPILNDIHPFQQIHTDTIPAQGSFRISHYQACPSASQMLTTQRGYPLSQPLPIHPGYVASQPFYNQTGYPTIQQTQTQTGYPPFQPESTQQFYPLSQDMQTYPTTQLSPFQPQPAYLVTQHSPQPQAGNLINQTANPNGQTLTKEQLAQFTGKNGMPAYVAVNGVVYDVTNNAAWSLATHFGLSAGRDLTAEFASCHAGQLWILAQLKPIGRLV